MKADLEKALDAGNCALNMGIKFQDPLPKPPHSRPFRSPRPNRSRSSKKQNESSGQPIRRTHERWRSVWSGAGKRGDFYSYSSVKEGGSYNSSKFTSSFPFSNTSTQSSFGGVTFPSSTWWSELFPSFNSHHHLNTTTKTTTTTTNSKKRNKPKSFFERFKSYCFKSKDSSSTSATSSDPFIRTEKTEQVSSRYCSACSSTHCGGGGTSTKPTTNTQTQPSNKVTVKIESPKETEKTAPKKDERIDSKIGGDSSNKKESHKGEQTKGKESVPTIGKRGEPPVNKEKEERKDQPLKKPERPTFGGEKNVNPEKTKEMPKATVKTRDETNKGESKGKEKHREPEEKGKLSIPISTAAGVSGGGDVSTGARREGGKKETKQCQKSTTTSTEQIQVEVSFSSCCCCHCGGTL